MAKYKIGDTVWVPQAGRTQVEVPCPVCFGKKVVTLILGNDDHVVQDCEFCRKGFDAPRGVVVDYQYFAKAFPITLDAVCVETRKDGEHVEYKVAYSSYEEKNLFATKEDAEAAAKTASEKQIAEESERENYRKQSVSKSFSWNAGYWMREAKKLREDAERCDKRAQVQSARARSQKNDSNKEDIK